MPAKKKAKKLTRKPVAKKVSKKPVKHKPDCDCAVCESKKSK